MNPLVWIVLGLGMGLIELFSTTFVLMWIAVASVVTGLLAFSMKQLGEQTAIFSVLTALLLLLTRPLVKRWRDKKSGFQSHISELVGERGVVISRIEAGKTGMVRVGSDVWSARSASSQDSFEPGQWVEIMEVRSSLLVVGPRKSS